MPKLADTSRQYTLGLRLGFARNAESAFDLRLAAVGRESANVDDDPEDRVGLSFSFRW